MMAREIEQTQGSVRAENHLPRVLRDEHLGLTFGTVLIPLQACPICARWMVLRRSAPTVSEDVPLWGDASLSGQYRRAGWTFPSAATDANGHAICEVCAKAGRAAFVCVRCRQERPSSQIRWSVGHPPERLCVPCYETAPAKEWHDLKKRLTDEHRYDFE